MLGWQNTFGPAFIDEIGIVASISNRLPVVVPVPVKPGASGRIAVGISAQAVLQQLTTGALKAAELIQVCATIVDSPGEPCVPCGPWAPVAPSQTYCVCENASVMA